MSTMPAPEYVGGPRCGEVVEFPDVDTLIQHRPKIGGKVQAKHTYVYERCAASGQYTLTEVRE